jgi:hypothetical protein
MADFKRNSYTELLKLPDCAGLLENGKCRWLNVTACSGAKCSYSHGISGLSKAQLRLRSLNEETQERISQKYYGGSRPWMDAD